MAVTRKNLPAVSVIVTVLNEDQTIEKLIKELTNQTVKPKEIIVVDGGSNDETFSYLQKLVEKNNHLRIFQRKGNRSIGRNLAISQSKTELVAITDAGCLPKNNWLEELVKAYQGSEPETVIAGYYFANPKTDFEQAVVPYALVMPDSVDPKTFLPATRSMLLPKRVWQKLAGFNESLSDNEDYDFARRLKKANVPTIFAKAAQVEWQPRSDLYSFAVMIFRFARGDAFAQLFRLKVVFIFARYSVGLGVLFLWWQLAIFGFGFYLLWSIYKNKHYVPSGWYWLPILQVVSDFAVMVGTMAGLIQYFRKNASI